MTERTISLRQLREHVCALDQLVTDAWMSTGASAAISFDAVRENARSILSLVGDSQPAAKDRSHVLPKSAPLAAVTARVPAQDKAPAFDLPGILGLSHIRKGS